MEKHDVVIIGGGHNGLIVAAYLAKAKLDVCVVEIQDKVGGGVITRELTLPGFKHDPGSVVHETIQANPIIHRDELGLKSKYGLKYIFLDPVIAFIYPDDSALVVYRDIDKTCDSIRQFSRRDAEAYPKFCEASRRMLKTAQIAMFSPPPPFGTMMSFLDASEEGREFMRVILSGGMDIVEEWFESEQVKMALTRWVCEMMLPPREKGTGNYIFGFPMFHSWGMPVPEGGSGALSEALAACIRDNGGTIKVSSPVTAVKVETGEAKGVILESGEEIVAQKAVVSGVNVKQLFLQMLKPEEIPAGFPDKVRRIRQCTVGPLNQAFALNQAPKYKAGGDVDRCAVVEITPLVDEIFTVFEALGHGIPRTETPFLTVASLVDPTRAPKGKHTLYLLHYEPYSLKDGGPSRWDEIKQEVADGVLNTLRQHCTNMGPENILGRWIGSPVDFERSNPAFIAGDFNHIAPILTQFFGNRPLPGWSHYRTPVKKLYMCGASTHPGGSVCGGGRAAVQVVMEDLGIDFRKVIAK